MRTWNHLVAHLVAYNFSSRGPVLSPGLLRHQIYMWFTDIQLKEGTLENKKDQRLFICLGCTRPWVHYPAPPKQTQILKKKVRREPSNLTWYRVRVKSQCLGRLRQEDLMVAPSLGNKPKQQQQQPQNWPVAVMYELKGRFSAGAHTWSTQHNPTLNSGTPGIPCRSHPYRCEARSVICLSWVYCSRT